MTNWHETLYARTKQMHETGRHGVATSVLLQGAGGKLSKNLFDRPRNMKLQMFFYQNPVKTQNKNFRPKFTFVGFSQNFVFGKVVPLHVRGHICLFASFFALCTWQSRGAGILLEILLNRDSNIFWTSCVAREAVIFLHMITD